MKKVVQLVVINFLIVFLLCGCGKMQATVDIKENLSFKVYTSIKLSDLNNELIYTGKTNNEYKIVPFSNPDIKTYLNDYERVYNKYANIVRSMDSSININSLS